MNPPIRISLVVATYNRSAALVELLGSVAAQTLDPALWECVVVDNRSTDDTAARFDAFAREHPALPLRRIYEPKQGLSHARNAGIAASRGEIVAIVDDDERINPGFLSAYVGLFDSRPDASSAGGRVIPVYETGRPHWMSPYTEQPIANPMDWGDRVRLFPEGHIPAGGNMAFRRTVLERCGLFNPDLGRIGDRLIGGEESDLFARLRRAGEPCYYTPGAVIEHIIPARKLTRDYFDRLCYNVGVSQRARAALDGTSGRLCVREGLKWGATLLIAAGYLFTLRPAKALWLLRMRLQITRGIRG